MVMPCVQLLDHIEGICLICVLHACLKWTIWVQSS